MVNTKKTENCEKIYEGFTLKTFNKSVTTVDQSIELCVQKTLSSLEALSIADLTEFLVTESMLTWPKMATSHLAQVRLLL